MTNPVGRPRLYKSVEQFEAKVQEYRAACLSSEEPITWTGLCLYLGFSSRQSLDEYLEYPEFSDSVRKAKMMVEMEYEKRLHTGQCTGAIFALKNFNWQDKTQVEQKSTVVDSNEYEW
jgi:hypothetical protein